MTGSIENNPSVGRPGSGEAQKVLITRHNDSALGTGKAKMCFIIGSPETGLVRGSYVDSRSSQGSGHSPIDVFVKMEADAVRHGKGPAVSPASVMDCCSGRLRLTIPLHQGSGRSRPCD